MKLKRINIVMAVNFPNSPSSGEVHSELVPLGG